MAACTTPRLTVMMQTSKSTSDKFENLTCREFGAVAESLVRSLSELNLNVPPSSDLEEIIHDFAWIGQHHGYVFDKDGPYHLNKDRLVKSFPLYERIRRLSRIVALAQDTPGAPERIRWLRKRFNQLVSHGDRSHDFLWEVEVAARCIRVGFDTTFAEPDVITTIEPLGQVAIACKRPRTRRGLADSVSKAGSQINNASLHGVIAMNVEALIHDSGLKDRPLHFIAPNQAAFRAHLTHVRSELARLAHTSIADVFSSSRIAAVVLYSLVTGINTAPSGVIWDSQPFVVPNLRYGSASIVMRLLDGLFRQAI